jgi:hypothetical protein
MLALRSRAVWQNETKTGFGKTKPNLLLRSPPPWQALPVARSSRISLAPNLGYMPPAEVVLSTGGKNEYQ